MKILDSFKNLTRFETMLWGASLIAVFLSFLFSDKSNYISLVASLIGVTALIFVSKGDVLGQQLTVIFALLYSFVSYTFKYYGEMITYLFMSAPISAMSIVSWIKNPYKKEKQQVLINTLKKTELLLIIILSIIVTIVFYYILKAFNTSNLLFSTISITTSFLASALMFRRSELYALAYAANDIVLIILWILATVESIKYLPMIICFFMFLANDLYGFFNWSKIKEKQKSSAN